MDTSHPSRPLGPLILLIGGILVALAVFWIGFMLAPAAILLISYLALSAGERGRHQQRVDSSPPEEIAVESTGSQAAAATGRPMSSRAGGQIGVRRGGGPGARHGGGSHLADSDLVEAGSVSSQPRGAQQ